MILLSRSSSFVLLLFLSTMLTPLFAQEVAQAATTEATIEKGAQSNTNSTPTVEVSNLLERLVINQGKGPFVQQKHFSFMSVPITSTGHFIVKDESALWQTEQPVFSALLLTPDAIYRRLSLEDDYQLLTDSAEFSAILSTIFTGKVNEDDWQLASSNNNTCLKLTPKSGQLKQLFNQVDLCLINEESTSETNASKHTDKSASSASQQRQITLTDSKGDNTLIIMTLSNDDFSSADLEAVKLTPNQLGNVNDS